MADSDHSPEAYRQLFALLGAGLMGMSLLFIAASTLVLPLGAVLVLGTVWLAALAVGIAQWRRRPWLPLVLGTLLAVLWILVLTAGPAVFGWSR